jgi:hypothetical protein
MNILFRHFKKPFLKLQAEDPAQRRTVRRGMRMPFASARRPAARARGYSQTLRALCARELYGGLQRGPSILVCGAHDGPQVCRWISGRD